MEGVGCQCHVRPVRHRDESRKIERITHLSQIESKDFEKSVVHIRHDRVTTTYKTRIKKGMESGLVVVTRFFPKKGERKCRIEIHDQRGVVSLPTEYKAFDHIADIAMNLFHQL